VEQVVARWQADFEQFEHIALAVEAWTEQASGGK
jgi:hypothetical protein